MSKLEHMKSQSALHHDTSTTTKLTLWWLRNYESITHFWTGFSWVWVIGVLLAAIAGHLDLRLAISVIFLFGIISNTGIYLCVRAMSAHLKQLEDCPEKEEAHELMRQIIKRRVMHRV